MKPHFILKSFKGSQTGIDSHEFEAGTVRPLSDSLAAIAVKEGWARPHAEQSPATKRETKVVAPEETKVVDPAEVKEVVEAPAEPPAETDEVKPEARKGGKKK